MKNIQNKEEKRKKWDNFWYYYKYHVLIAVFLLVVLVTFFRDMLTKVEYDLSVAVVGDAGMLQEEKDRLGQWFQERAEDLNGDGEVHVQILDYYIPQGDADPQMLMANQTKLTVDMQEAQSMIYFFSEANLERYKDSGVLSADPEDYIPAEECPGYKEAGEPVSLKGTVVGLRFLDETSQLAQKEEVKARYQESEKLFYTFTGK